MFSTSSAKWSRHQDKRLINLNTLINLKYCIIKKIFEYTI